jgi:8-oxo-dGTP pyrophosphatase MutT (NUDIX family)
MKYINTVFEKFRDSKKIHTLSGVALIVDGKILLVKATKYRKQKNRWSIPKGHIEGNSLTSALKELKEETGITIDRNFNDIFEIDYKMGDNKKSMDIYVYYKNKTDILEYIDEDWSIKKKFLDPKEIIKAKFIDIEESKSKIDPRMSKILKRLIH